MIHSDSGKFPPPQNWQQSVRKAAAYAAFAQDHPLYQLKADGTPVSAYSLAFLDCLRKPRLLGMDIRKWTGRPGQPIHIQIWESIHIFQVRVMFRDHLESDTVLESGYAYPSQLNSSIWTYISKTEFRQMPGFCIDILASDLAGNVSNESIKFDRI